MLKAIVQRAGIIDSKIVTIPLKLNQKLSTSDDTPIFDLTCCQQVVGCLAYLTITWPDIAYPVKVVTLSPLILLFIGLIFLYIQGTMN